MISVRPDVYKLGSPRAHGFLVGDAACTTHKNPIARGDHTWFVVPCDGALHQTQIGTNCETIVARSRGRRVMLACGLEATASTHHVPEWLSQHLPQSQS